MSSGPQIAPGKIVRVRLGLVLGLAAGCCVVVAVVGLLMGMRWWTLVLLTVAAIVASAVSVTTGIRGVVRHGIFTEGQGVRQVSTDLRRATWARLAATTGSAALMGSIVLAVAVLLKITL